MPRRTFVPEGIWSIDLPDAFEAHTPSTWEVWEEPRFVTPERAVWADFFESGEGSPRETLDRYLDRHEAGEKAAEYRSEDAANGLSRYAILVAERDTPEVENWYLKAWTAGKWVIAEMTFVLASRDDVDWALAAWQSVQYHLPPLRRLCDEDPAALRDLCRALEGGAGSYHPIQALRQGGRTRQALALLQAALQEPAPRTRAEACLAMDHLGEPEAVPDLRSALSDPDTMVRMRAADALCRFREPAEDLVPVLIAALHDPEPPDLPQGRDRVRPPCGGLALPEARYHAARILGYLGGAAEPAREALREALGSACGIVRAAAAQTLARLGEPGETYLGPLYQALHDAAAQHPRERVWVAETLVELGEPPESVIAVVAEMVGEEWTAASWAMRFLGKLGPAARPAIPALREALRSEQQGIRERAAETLKQLGETP